MRVELDSGETIDLGITETAPTIGLTDYSRRVTDDFGVTTVAERGFARRMSVRLSLPTDQVDRVQRRLADLRAAPALWVADERFASLSVRGFYKDFAIDVAFPPQSFATLTVEGLVAAEPFTDSGIDPAPDGRASTLQLLQPVLVTGGMLATTNVDEADAAEWSAGTTYGLGARVIQAATHRIYESAVAGNVGNDPAGSSGKWIDAGATNRWRMFDEALGSATSRAGVVDVTIAPGTLIDAVALLDVVADTVRVRAAGYDRTLTPTGQSGSTLFLDVPATSGSVRVTIAGAGDVSIGTLLIGRLRGLGITEASPSAGITDYSRKTTDEFGEVTVVERAWAKRMALRAQIRSDAVDLVTNRIASVRARPSLWIGSEGLDTLTVYGFFKDFSAEIGDQVSTVSLSIEGLSAAARLTPLSISTDWADLTDRTGTKPEPNATNSADPASPFGNSTVGALEQLVSQTRDLVTSIQTAIENTDLGDSGLAEAARLAAQAAQAAAEAALNQAVLVAQIAGEKAGEAGNFAFSAHAAAQLADQARAAVALLTTAVARSNIGLLNINAMFTDYPESAQPTGWNTDGDRAAGWSAPYAVRLIPGRSVTQIDRTRLPGGGYMVVEIDVHGSGNLDDIFIGLQSFDDGGAIRYGNGWYLGHEKPVDNGATAPIFSAVNGEAYRYRIFVDARTADARNWVIYAVNVGGGTFLVDRLGYRFATPGEVDGRAARDLVGTKADYTQLVQLGTDLNASIGQVDQRLSTQLSGASGSGLLTQINSKASTGYVDNAVSTEAGSRAQHEQQTAAEFMRVDNRIDSTNQVLSGKASSTQLQQAIATEQGARAQAIADQRVSFNGRSLSLQQFGEVLATPDGKLQGLWGIGFNNGVPVLSIYYRDDNGVIQKGAFLDMDLIVAGAITAREIKASGVTKQYGATLGQELIGDYGFSWQAGPTISFDLENDADVLVIGTGGNAYYDGLPAFESALAIDGVRGSGGSAAGAGSYSIPIAMSTTTRLGAGSHTAQFQWRGGAPGIHLAQATLIVLRAYR